MPVRRSATTSTTTTKVFKPPSKRSSRTSSLSSSAQEQLEQLAQQADADADATHEARTLEPPIEEDPVDLEAAGILTSGAIAHLHPALQSPSNFQLHDEMQEDDPRTAADIALDIYGDLIKIDSAFCKKLANETAQREPTQRRADQKLNMERRSNVEALLAQMTGQTPARPCKNCHKGHGPWTQCVVYDGQMCGSCSNCWFNASGSRCTFHENNHPPVPPSSAPAVLSAGTPSMLAYHAVPLPQHPALAHGMAPLQADISHWEMSATTRQIVDRALEDAARYTRGKRLAARIEAAAKELAMRVAEFDEYSRSPEGIAELQREDSEAHGHASDPALGDHPSPDDALP